MKEESEDEDELSAVDSNEEEIITEPEDEVEEVSPPRGIKRKRNQSVRSTKKQNTFSTPTHSPRPSSFGQSTQAKLSSFRNTPGTPKAKDSKEEKLNDWPHLKYDFLHPDKIMDKKRRRPDHPDYDKRTLYVPEDFKNKVTPVSWSFTYQEGFLHGFLN